MALFVALMAVGRYLLPPLFHEIARSRSEELFVLSALAVVLGAAWLTHALHMSMALGALWVGYARRAVTAISRGGHSPFRICSWVSSSSARAHARPALACEILASNSRLRLILVLVKFALIALMVWEKPRDAVPAPWSSRRASLAAPSSLWRRAMALRPPGAGLHGAVTLVSSAYPGFGAGERGGDGRIPGPAERAPRLASASPACGERACTHPWLWPGGTGDWACLRNGVPMALWTQTRRGSMKRPGPGSPSASGMRPGLSQRGLGLSASPCGLH